MKRSLIIISIAMLFVIQCTKPSVIGDFNEIKYSKNIETNYLKRLAISQINLKQMFSKIDASIPDFKWEEFSEEIGRIQTDNNLENVLNKYKVNNISNLKTSLLNYVNEYSNFVIESKVANLNNIQKKELTADYILIYNKFDLNQEKVSSLGDLDDKLKKCMDECRATYLEESLLCASACLFGPISCWVGAACMIFKGNQLDRCIAGCQAAYGNKE